MEIVKITKRLTPLDVSLSQLGQKLKEIRRRRGRTQKEIADELGIPYQDYQKYEYGLTYPKKERYAELCDALDIPIDNSVFEFDY